MFTRFRAYTDDMNSFDEIVVIYNPNSTGSSEENAKTFMAEVREALPEQSTTIRKTEYAGHAEKIGAEYAKQDRRVLLVSSSGDGGYNEVVNGVLRSGDTNHVTVAVLPSGNANDHARHMDAVMKGSLIENIVAGNQSDIEAIEVKASVDGKPWTRFAHSYVGFGLTPKVGHELTVRKLNAFNEKWHTAYHMLKFKHIDLTYDGDVRRYTSLVFSTISSMSKIIKLEQSARNDDGLMEVYEMPYQTPLQLVKTLLRASLKGLSKNERTEKYEIRTIKKTLVQLDGEVFTIDPDTDVMITCKKRAIKTIL